MTKKGDRLERDRKKKRKAENGVDQEGKKEERGRAVKGKCSLSLFHSVTKRFVQRWII